MKKLIPAAPLCAVLLLGYAGAAPVLIALSCVAFVIAVLCFNPLDLLDVLPARSRYCLACAVLLATLSAVPAISAPARLVLILCAVLCATVSIKRRYVWRTSELVRQSPAVDTVLSSIGADKATGAGRSWNGHGKAESRALLHQIAGVEITEPDVERICAPVYQLGYIHGIAGTERLQAKIKRLEQDRVDSLCRIAALEAQVRGAEALTAELEQARKQLAQEPERPKPAIAPPPPEPEQETEPEDKQSRNARIAADRDAGMTLGELAERYAMTRSGIQHVLRMQRGGADV